MTSSPVTSKTDQVYSAVTGSAGLGVGGGGVVVTPYNGLYREAPPERGTFFRLQVYKRVGVSQVEVLQKGSREFGQLQ